MKARIIKISILFLAIISIATECNKEEEIPQSGVDGYFTITPETGFPSTVFSFDASKFYYYDDNGEDYDVNIRWDFDYTGEGDILWDRDFSTQDIVTHQYNNAKEYTVRTEVHLHGIFLMSSKVLIVTQPNNSPPVADFTIGGSPGYPFVYLFSFNAGLCTDQQDPTDSLQVRWDWENDGNYDTEFSKYKNIDYVYNYTGEIEVKMQVRDKGGLLADLTKSLIVQGPVRSVHKPALKENK